MASPATLEIFNPEIESIGDYKAIIKGTLTFIVLLMKFLNDAGRHCF